MKTNFTGIQILKCIERISKLKALNVRELLHFPASQANGFIVSSLSFVCVCIHYLLGDSSINPLTLLICSRTDEELLHDRIFHVPTQSRSTLLDQQLLNTNMHWHTVFLSTSEESRSPSHISSNAPFLAECVTGHIPHFPTSFILPLLPRWTSFPVVGSTQVYGSPFGRLGTTELPMLAIQISKPQDPQL